MARYVTLEQAQGYFPRINPADEPAVEALLDRMSSLIAVRLRLIRRDILDLADVDPSERTFTGDGSDVLLVHPFVADSLTTVIDPDGIEIAATEDQPNAIVRADGGVFADGVRYVVTARWGWEEVLPEITELTLQSAVRAWRGRDEAFSGTRDNTHRDGSIIERGFPRMVEQTLDDMRTELIELGWANVSDPAATVPADEVGLQTPTIQRSASVRNRPTW